MLPHAWCERAIEAAAHVHMAVHTCVQSTSCKESTWTFGIQSTVQVSHQHHYSMHHVSMLSHSSSVLCRPVMHVLSNMFVHLTCYREVNLNALSARYQATQSAQKREAETAAQQRRDAAVRAVKARSVTQMMEEVVKQEDEQKQETGMGRWRMHMMVLSIDCCV